MTHENGRLFLQELPGIDNNLPYSPELSRQLFIQTESDSNASLEDIAATVEQDQGLTARLLDMANSAFYGLQSQVTTVARAAAVLGLGEIRAIVLTLGVNSLTSKYPCPPEFDMENYWLHQLTVAEIARTLARKFEDVNSGSLFTAGLLHDLGKLLAAMHRPEDWRAVNAMVKKQNITYRLAEEEYWGLDHGLIGALVLKSWNLPDELSEPVSWHHAPPAAPDFKSASYALATADALAHALEDPESPEARPLLKYAEKINTSAEELLEEAAQAGDPESRKSFVSRMR